MPKVSVLVPVYKVEAYIERCARSLFEQTLDDMEFILWMMLLLIMQYQFCKR